MTSRNDALDDLDGRLNSVEVRATDFTVRTKRDDAGVLETVVQFKCALKAEDLVQLFRLGTVPGPMVVNIKATQYEMRG